MTLLTIADHDLDPIKDQVVVITGASSGIGLATLRRIIQHGGKVFACDLKPLPEPEAASVPFLKVDVSSWENQVALFKAAEKEYGKIDHVFANAGIGSMTSLVEDDVDENGDCLPPNLSVLDVNLIGCIYTVKLGIFYIKKNPHGGSVVITSSGTSYARFPATDYATTKHGVLGLMRALSTRLHPKLPIRINAVAPAWTETAIVPTALLSQLGPQNSQSPDVVARSVLLLMVDGKRHGDMIQSHVGEFRELENGEEGFHGVMRKLAGFDSGEMTFISAFKSFVEGVDEKKGQGTVQES